MKLPVFTGSNPEIPMTRSPRGHTLEPKSSPPPDVEQPSPRDLRAALLWCARWLLPGGGFHDGKLTVRIKFDSGERVEIKPERAADGRTLPDSVQFAENGPTIPQLRGHFLGASEKTVLRSLVNHGPCRTKELQERVEQFIERSEFYLVKKNLLDRELIAEDREGRVIIPEAWIEKLVTAPVTD